jgi:iron complex outermembrane recepter protein
MKKSVVVALSLFSGVYSFAQNASNAGGAFELSPIRVIAGDTFEDSGAPTSSFTTGAIDLYQMQSVQETSALVPNLFVSSSDTRGFGDTITMRGMGNTLFFSPAGVALYVDDVPSGDVFTYSSELFSGNALTVHLQA